MTWDDMSVGFEDPLRHLVPFTFGRAEDAAKDLSLQWEADGVLAIIAPFEPRKLARV